MRILFADRLPDRTIHDLEAHGHECVMEPGLGADDLAERIGGYDVLVVRGTQVRRPVIEAADRLALVIRAGAGTNTIDTDAAAERAVFVSNVPGRNAAAVAELTMGLLLAVDRRIADNVADVREGRWDKKTYGNAEGLLGSTMGILGLGSIGFLVAERAAAFGIRVQSIAKEGRSPTATARAEELGITMCGSLDELLGSCDIVSLHVPSSPETKHLVDAAFLARMRPGAILLNTSRGDVVDEAALLAALDEGRVRAGLDVFDGEPGSGQAEWESPLARHPAVVATHHIGASTAQAQRAIAEGVTEIVDAFTAGEARHCVNLVPDRLGASALAVRHLDRVGVLAQVLDVLSTAHLNVQHMVNRVFRGGEAAVAFIDVEGDASHRAAGCPACDPARARRLGGGARRGCRGHAMTTVRPFSARVVRQESARRTVSAMSDSQDESGVDLYRVAVDSAAYDDSPVALYVYRQSRGDASYTGVVCDVAVPGHRRGPGARARGRAPGPRRRAGLAPLPDPRRARAGDAAAPRRAGVHPRCRGSAADRAGPGLRRTAGVPADRVAAR